MNVLYDLALNATETGFMRQEIKDIVAREGWSKNALDKMHSVDSFIKESMRINGIFTCASSPVTKPKLKN